MPQSWIQVSRVALLLGVASFAIVGVDLVGRRQRMWIMNVVWPITALWAGPLGAWAYFRHGRAAETSTSSTGPKQGEGASAGRSFAVAVAKSATHCGSGCAMGDILAEPLALAVPLTLFGHRMFGTWVYDLVAAFVFGIAFQYFTIRPMRDETASEGLKDALKADTLSLCAWQVGMYGWMAIATFVIFHHELAPTSAVFWFMMQLGMFAGFATSYPVNWLLLRRGLKEAM